MSGINSGHIHFRGYSTIQKSTLIFPATTNTSHSACRGFKKRHHFPRKKADTTREHLNIPQKIDICLPKSLIFQYALSLFSHLKSRTPLFTEQLLTAALGISVRVVAQYDNGNSKLEIFA